MKTMLLFNSDTFWNYVKKEKNTLTNTLICENNRNALFDEVTG